MRILVLTLMMSFLSHSAFGAAEGGGGASASATPRKSGSDDKKKKKKPEILIFLTNHNDYKLGEFFIKNSHLFAVYITCLVESISCKCTNVEKKLLETASSYDLSQLSSALEGFEGLKEEALIFGDKESAFEDKMQALSKVMNHPRLKINGLSHLYSCFLLGGFVQNLSRESVKLYGVEMDGYFSREQSVNDRDRAIFSNIIEHASRGESIVLNIGKSHGINLIPNLSRWSKLNGVPCHFVHMSFEAARPGLFSHWLDSINVESYQHSNFMFSECSIMDAQNALSISKEQVLKAILSGIDISHLIKNMDLLEKLTVD